MDYRYYSCTLKKRGRPKEYAKDKIDLGTKEIQARRLLLTGKSSKAHLSSTYIGLLYSKRLLTRTEYETANAFMKLSWKIRKIFNSPTLAQAKLEKLRILFGERKDCMNAYLFNSYTQEDKEEEIRKNIALYSHSINDLKKAHSRIFNLTLDALQYDQIPSNLIQLITQKGDKLSYEILNNLKAGIKIIKASLKNFSQ